MKRIVKKFYYKLKKFLRVFIFKTTNKIFNVVLPLKCNKILILSDVRDVLGGNLEFFYNQVKKLSNYDIVILLKKNRRTRRCLKDKFELVYQLSTSKYIILDDASKAIALMEPREEQEICQLWHASGAFKTFGYSRKDRNPKKKTDIWHYKYTKAFVSSEKIRDCYSEGFGIDKEKVIASGTPRTDLFFNEELKNQVKKQILKKYPNFKNKKIILFAPTYRGKSVRKASYRLDAIDYHKLYNSLRNDYIFIFKWHPAIYWNLGDALQNELSYMGDFYYDFSFDRDINDLLLLADILITDYSSVLFDWALLKKPIIYFVYDLYSYILKRGFYFKFNEYVYGPIATNSDQLLESIKNAEFDKKQNRLFLDKFMSECDGNSTNKVIDSILQSN
jgi:CDP-ribitol ribitolphosphotransferase